VTPLGVGVGILLGLLIAAFFAWLALRKIFDGSSLSWALAALLVALPAAAQEPPSTISITAGGAVSLSDESAVVPWVSLLADGPLYLGDSAPLRARATLTLEALPGETLDLSAVETFKAAVLEVELQRRIGGDADGSATYIFGRGGFATRFLPQDPAPRERFARSLCVGVRAERRDKDGSISRTLGLAYGRAELASPQEWNQGQLVFDGFARVAQAGQVDFLVGGRAELNVTRQPGPGARDVMQAYVTARR
jgi:hypothetical protein